jgi:WD40 repeat protein
VDFDESGQFLAAGYSSAGFSIFSLTSSKASGQQFRLSIAEESFRKDAREEISDIKFSPSNNRLAVGSADSHIYVYKCSLAPGACSLRSLHRLSGHSSHITHLDWSNDSNLLQSTCGAYELL